MSKELFVSSTPHETKVAIVEEDQLAEVYFERENEYTLAGSIYKGRVTRVLPGMQSAFVNVGLERDAFLYVSDFLLEEDEESDSLDQVVVPSRKSDSRSDDSRGEFRSRDSRSHDSRSHDSRSGDSRSHAPRGEAQARPIEADEIIPPVEEMDEAGGEQERGAAAPGESREEGDREGSRKWRGRRRRGRGRDRDRSSDRPGDRPADRPQEIRTESAPDGEEHEAAVVESVVEDPEVQEFTAHEPATAPREASHNA